MNQLDGFLRRHATVHSQAATGADFSMEWVYAGLSDDALRARPHGLNSIAWLLWHVARVEDGCIAGIVLGAPPLLDDGWTRRLGVDVLGDGEGMSKAEVAALSEALDLDALRAYRDAVCGRTRELVARLRPESWHEPLTDREIADAVARGAIPADEAAHIQGRARDGMLQWWGIEHTHYHLGQAAMIRRLGRM